MTSAQPENLDSQPLDRPRVRDAFAIDLRSLAAVRIGLGLVLLIDLGTRVSGIRDFYTDDGILPISAWRATISVYSQSLHVLSGGAWLPVSLFILAAICAAALLVGFYTPLATLLSFVLFASLMNRNPMVTHGGDLLLRLLLFWMIFLPSGSRYSVDEMRRTARGKPTAASRVLSIPSAALLLQVCIVYWFNAFNKHDWIWWNGEAIAYALNIDYFATPLGKWLLQYPTLLQWMTWVVLILEFAGPTIALSPLRTGPLRIIVILLFWGLHIGLDLTLELGLFSYSCMVAWLAFAPPAVWDWFERKLLCRAPATDTRAMLGASLPVQVFSGVALFYVLAWNIRALDFNRLEPYFPRSLNWFGESLQLDQYWAMFAPYPAMDDGWYVIPAKLADGSEVDLWTGNSVTWDKPDQVADAYRDPLWRKYLNNLYEAVNSHHREYFAQYLARQWDRQHGPEKTVVSLEIIYMLERTRSLTKSYPAEPIVLWTHTFEGASN